jgi:YVTN family beta-propeller protein
VVAFAVGAPNEMEFRVLGSLEVVDHDGPVALGAPKQRALLAVLLLHRGEPVSTDRLIDEIWGERPPASANKLVQGYVSNLRKVLGDGRLVTQGRGYVFRIEPGQTDVDRFEALAARGRRALQDGDALTAAAVLREALALWRGPALSDFAYEPFAQPEIARLEEARLVVLEDRIDADLASGEQARLVGELEALVREHPLRERLQGQLMLALYRSGRQADALGTYHTARDRLIDELGLEPGRALRELERAILDQDRALDLNAPDSKREASAGARRRRRGGLLIAIGGGLLLAVLIAVAVTIAGSGGSTLRVVPNSVAAIDIGSDRVVGAIPVGDQPGAIAFGSGSLWVANLGDQTISRVDPNNRQTFPVIPVDGPPAGIAAGPGGPWVVDSPGASSVLVGRVDPVFNTFGSVAHVGNVAPPGPVAIASQGNSVWVAPSTGELTRFDSTTGSELSHLDPNASPAGVAVGYGAVWLTDPEAGNVVRVDPSGLLTPIAVGDAPTGIAVGGNGVWVADPLDDTVVRIDPDTRSPTATISVGRSPAGVAYGAGSVWVANSGDGTVTRINPTTDRPQATITVGGSPQAITIADGKAWVTVDEQSIPPTSAPDGGTLRLVSSSDVPSLDPANSAGAFSTQILYATCAQLLNYPDKAGPAGSQLIPEVAQSLPARSPDGRTYTFKIRPGFRFSPPSNAPVTAQTFKDTIERTLNPRTQSYYAQDLSDIVGASAYMSGKASHVAGVIANGETLTIRLLAPEPDFLARIAQPPASCAVPSDTPINPKGENIIPSAGPYYVKSYTPGQGVVLMRNPNYHGRRPHHFARIQLAVDISPERAVSEIEAGLADYTPVGLEATAGEAAAVHLSQLATQYGARSPAARRGAQQYFATPSTQLDYFVLNTHRPLFGDVRMRQAVNYAIDRDALAGLGDGFDPLPTQPTDHYLPPGIPGFRDSHVYPMTPNVAKARELAQGDGRTAVLYTCDSSPCPEQAHIVQSDLAAIGLRVLIKTIPFSSYYTVVSTKTHAYDLAWDGWVPDYFDPESMLTSILEDSSVGPTFDDPAYQRRLAAAARLTGPERYLTYGQLDLDLARDAAPLLAFDNLTVPDFFSARIGCQTYGVFGMDLGALCIRRAHPG